MSFSSACLPVKSLMFCSSNRALRTSGSWVAMRTICAGSRQTRSTPLKKRLAKNTAVFCMAPSQTMLCVPSTNLATTAASGEDSPNGVANFLIMAMIFSQVRTA